MNTKRKFRTILAVFRERVVSLAGIYPLARKFLRIILQKATILYMRLLHKSPPQVSTRPFSMFNERKTAQLAAYLLAKHGGKMSHLKLMKLLYLCERESLKIRGVVLTGDRLISMDHGPVLSNTLNLMDGDTESSPDGWGLWITTKEDNELKLVHEDPDLKLGSLSQSDREIADSIWNSFGHLTKWQIRDYTHTLPEWRDPHGSSIPINIKKLFESFGQNKDEINRSIESLEEECAIKKALAAL